VSPVGRSAKCLRPFPAQPAHAACLRRRIDRIIFLLRRMSPAMALLGHGAMSDLSLLAGV
jgi:hypothetical protein